MEPLRLYTSRRKQVLFLLASVAFAIWSAFEVTQPEPPMNKVYLVLAVAFFTLAAAYLAVALVLRWPALVIDREGITDSSNLAAGGRIAWSEIRGVRIAEIRSQRTLAVDLFYPDAVPARVPAARRALLHANLGLTGAPVNIPESTLPFGLEQVIAEMTMRNPGLPVG
jgi:hypothetical protein